MRNDFNNDHLTSSVFKAGAKHMRTNRKAIGLAAISALLLGSACSKDEAVTQIGDGKSNLDFKVSALNLTGVNGVVYGIHLLTADGQTVWERTDLDSTRFGDNVGSISYVGPCDSTPSSNPHRVELTLIEMRSAPGVVIDPSTYQNPGPVGSPLVLNVDCIENADTPVTFNLTIMRDAQQGFFDIGVTFDDIFCSAKFDCLRNGQPFDMLHNPMTEERDTTVILGFACTAGGDGEGGGEPTWMHLSNVLVQCEDAEGNEVNLLLDPSGPEGNNGGAPPLFYQTGIYRGEEALEPYDKCYWNMAFGINLGTDTGLTNCHLRAQGTASTEQWGNPGASPANTTYPVVEWDIDLTDADGGLACSAHPLNGDPAGVSTTYTDWSGTTFSYEWECGTDTPVDPTALACAGTTELGDTTAFIPQPDGLTVKFGNSMDTAYYELPTGYAFGADTYCCVNPCCTNP